MWDSQVYTFLCFPNGLACCPRMFTKLMKPVYSSLRKQGHESSSYINDSYLQADDYADCVTNVRETIQVLDSLGFIPHPDKSFLVPIQRHLFREIFRVHLDVKNMRVYLTPEKADRLKNKCLALLK